LSTKSAVLAAETEIVLLLTYILLTVPGIYDNMKVIPIAFFIIIKGVIMADFNSLKTESYNEKTANIDKMSAFEIVRCINDEDKTVAFAWKKR
jgi:hypothetical protein